MKKLAVTLIAVFFCANYSAAEQKNIPAVVVSSADVIKEMEEIIASSYYRQDINARAFAEDLFIGKSSSDDPHSQYFPPVQRQALENEMRGIIYGIGVLIERKTVRNKKSVKNFLSVKEVVKNSPAEKAGLQSGDYVIAVASDGVKGHLIFLDGKSYERVIYLIRGEKDTPVYIRILRRGKKLDFIIVRGEIKQELVFGKFVRPGVGYVYLAEFFGDDTLDNFSVLVSSMQKNGMKALILDLRDNPGGSLDYAIKISKWFQEPENNGPVVFFKSRGYIFIDIRTQISNIVFSLSQGKFHDIPLVVIVNGNSASASEIVSVFLKNYCGVPVIGEKTYGKGTVQNVISLSNGGILKITIAEYLVGERKIQVNKIGVNPTIEIKNPNKVRNEKEDAQFQRAIKEAEMLIK